MPTSKELIDTAMKEIGVSEWPPNSNKVKYNTWYYGREVSGKEYPWCMVFCQYVFEKVGVKVPIRTASCTTMRTAARKNNCFVNNRHLEPGDLVLFNFKNPGATVATHCGIVRSINGIKMKVIEGNTSLSNDTNGGSVMLRNRTIYQSVGAFRPIFDDREDELDMTKAEFINSLTDQEAYLLLTKAMKHADKLKQPDWSKKEGYWDKAVKGKIITSNTPEGYLKRDEMIAILGRAKIL